MAIIIPRYVPWISGCVAKTGGSLVKVAPKSVVLFSCLVTLEWQWGQFIRKEPIEEATDYLHYQIELPDLTVSSVEVSISTTLQHLGESNYAYLGAIPI